MKSPEGLARTAQRRRFSTQFKRGVVEETLVPGASVAAIALRHRLNANLLFTRHVLLLGHTESARNGRVPTDRYGPFCDRCP